MKDKEPKVTVKKWNGDDSYSWAIFRNGEVVFAGLTKHQIPYYKEKAKQGYKEAFLIKDY